MGISLKNSTLQALQPLIGLPMWSGGRAANLVWLQFGTKRTVVDRSGENEVGDFALHLQCFWRIRDSKTIFVAASDRFYPRGDPFEEAEDFDWTEPNMNRCDEKLEELFHGRRASYLVVQSIQTDKYGGFSLSFRASLKLEVYLDDTVDSEKWRIFRPRSEDKHFVVTKVLSLDKPPR